jgi:hypothetical protein
MPSSGGGAGGHLQQCRYCKRKFNFDRHAKHEQVCIEGPGSRRRTANKPFNSGKQRLGELAAEAKNAARYGGGARTRGGGRGVGGGVPGRQNWRQQHNDFIAAMRAARRDAAAIAATKAVSGRSAVSYGRPLPAGFGGGGGGGGGGGFGNVQVAVPKRGPPAAQSGPAPFPSRSTLHSRGSTGNTSSSRYGGGGIDLPQGAPAARNAAPAMVRGPPTAGGGRISTSNETSADMKAIFGMGGRR